MVQVEETRSINRTNWLNAGVWYKVTEIVCNGHNVRGATLIARDAAQ